MRHGEAEPGIGRLGDLRRPLSELGKKHVRSLAKELKSRKLEFDLILVSPSNRTTQTSKIISDSIPHKKIQVQERIYDAEVNDLLKILQKIEIDTAKVLLVGHNPALSSLVAYLTGIDQINMSPGMFAIIEIVISDWAHIGNGTGLLIEMIG